MTKREILDLVYEYGTARSARDVAFHDAAAWAFDEAEAELQKRWAAVVEALAEKDAL